jgi:hypothetical protein
MSLGERTSRLGITSNLVTKPQWLCSAAVRQPLIALITDTSEVTSYRFSHGSHSYVLVDTPGFDDSTMSNQEVAQKVVQWLESSYRHGTRLTGIVYIHNITKPRMQGSAFQNIRMFRSLCGEDALKNVVLATSFWDEVNPSLGAERERELLTSKDFWANMVAKGSEVVRISPDRSVCLGVLERIAKKSQVDLLVQREIVLENRRVEDTTLWKADPDAKEKRKVEQQLARERQQEKGKMQAELKARQKAQNEEMERLRREQQRREQEQRQRLQRQQEEHQRERRRQEQERRESEWERRRLEEESRRIAQAQEAERRRMEAERRRMEAELAQWRQQQAPIFPLFYCQYPCAICGGCHCNAPRTPFTMYPPCIAYPPRRPYF